MTTAVDELDDGLDYQVDYSSDGGETVPVEIEETKVKEDTEEQPKKRKRTNEKLVNKKKMKMEQDVEEKQKLATATPEIIADFLASRIRKQNKDLSALELGELYLSKTVFKGTGDFDKPRTPENLSSFLNEFLERFIPVEKKKKAKKSKTSKEETKKYIVVVSMSALRACDIYRATKALPNSSLKIINKNKLQADLDILRKTDSRILAGTPGRMLKVLSHEDPPISSTEIACIVCDSSYLDSKKQTVWEIPETIEFLRKVTGENPNAKVYLY
ncbi:unnamed protein product [Kuraishia capsulata CBS 1993]|uniref:Protein CMS1 n=1 Tax=Kuraishia capsulata CBS 1993 TaxID=1382522 RepID=W6MQ08_9ASCO|nr:uncharacterized protein KUCA_T00003290001 [Kuraishia capsulata CBS 1993]CDK27312.1 unnamed protein product [Kuraishia capsulata CBS 1993]